MPKVLYTAELGGEDPQTQFFLKWKDLDWLTTFLFFPTCNEMLAKRPKMSKGSSYKKICHKLNIFLASG